MLLAFVLFHLSDPAQALAEAARMLTCGGSVGTATWARDDPMEADEVWEETLTEAGAPPLPARRVDAGLDSQDTIGGLIAGTGLQPVQIWREPLGHHWELPAYHAFAAGSGRTKQRLQHLGAEQRGEVLDRALIRMPMGHCAALPCSGFARRASPGDPTVRAHNGSSNSSKLGLNTQPHRAEATTQPPPRSD